jgi:hypothetical protein
MAYTTINKSTDYFNTKLFTGNGSTTQAITGVGFQPDWFWIKCRNEAADNQLSDAVRGKSGSLYYQLQSNGTGPQVVQGDNDGVHSLDSDGFTVGYTNSIAWNKSGNTYATWNWKANGSGSSNTDGTITSTVSANTTAGFSIVKYTGNATNSTVGHGLGVTPQVVIVKNLDSSGGSAEHWRVQHHKVPASKVLYLNKTDAEDNNGDFQSTYPGSSTFSISSADGCNKNGEANIAYCFAEKTGYSKFGSYTGNSNTNGTFVYTGFKPAWLMMKRKEAVNSWYIFDNKRNLFNVTNSRLKADDSVVEYSNLDTVDFLSNGFKFREGNDAWNGSGNPYIYMAFAAAPLVGSNNVPCTAR